MFQSAIGFNLKLQKFYWISTIFLDYFLCIIKNQYFMTKLRKKQNCLVYCTTFIKNIVWNY